MQNAPQIGRLKILHGVAFQGVPPTVVAIARVRRTAGRDIAPGIRARPLRPPADCRLAPPQPTDPNFVPNEYGTGVVIDRHGLILTAYHVLADDSDYYVTTAERKVYRATVKAADPRAIWPCCPSTAADLQPIALGDADGTEEGANRGHPGQSLRHRPRRPGQRRLGHRRQPGPQGPAHADESDPTGRPTLHHFGTLIQTDARLEPGHQRRTAGGSAGRNGRPAVALAATAGYEQAAGYAMRSTPPSAASVETLKQGREVEYGFLGIRPGDCGRRR